jgi:thiosulfate dehydrogenase (quinone) large subunit
VVAIAARDFYWLAAARIYVGVLWLNYGTSKFEPDWARTEFLSATQGSAAGTSGAMHDFLVAVVMPNQALFARTIAVGETLVGISLLLGLLTKIGSLGGMFLSMNYYFATGRYMHRLGFESLELLLFVICLLLFVLPSDRALSVDAVLRSRLRRITRL